MSYMIEFDANVRITGVYGEALHPAGEAVRAVLATTGQDVEVAIDRDGALSITARNSYDLALFARDPLDWAEEVAWNLLEALRPVAVHAAVQWCGARRAGISVVPARRPARHTPTPRRTSRRDGVAGIGSRGFMAAPWRARCGTRG